MSRPQLGIRPAALPAFRRLLEALAATGPTSCSADPDSWTTDHGADDRASDTTSLEYIARLCRRCPVHAECAEFATANNETAGIWAGIDRTPRVGRPAAASTRSTSEETA